MGRITELTAALAEQADAWFGVPSQPEGGEDHPEFGRHVVAGWLEPLAAPSPVAGVRFAVRPSLARSPRA